MSKRFIAALMTILFSTPSLWAADKIYDYGFENWTGDRYTTENYPFSSGYRDYCVRHDNSTEVVRSYQGWEPHSGDYFFLRSDAAYSAGTAESGSTTTLVDEELERDSNFWNGHPISISRGEATVSTFVETWDADASTLTLRDEIAFPIDSSTTYVLGFVLNPLVPGLPGGTVNDVGNIGLNGRACSQNDLVLGDEITTGEFFVRLWARHNPGFYGDFITSYGKLAHPYPGTKWIRVSCMGDSSDVFMHLSAGKTEENPDMLLYSSPEGYVVDRREVAGAYDGNWHKYSLYINFNTGTILGWFDTEVETTSNATVSYQAPDNAIGTATGAEHFVIQGNFCARWPMQITYHALDDIEIWNGLPSPSGPVIPSPPTNLIIDSVR